VTTPDTAAGTAATTAGGADTAAGTADTAAGGADTAAGTADTAAGGADTAAGGADTAAAAADVAAAAADGVALAQGNIDPVADGVAAGLDGTAAGLDTAAAAANTADAANGAADGANGTADGANGTADGANGTAETANTTFSGTTAAATAADMAANTADTAGAAAHTAAVVSDGFSAASNLAAAASDALTAQQYGSFAAGMSSPDTTGNNPNNAAYQNAVHGLAVTGATLHSASAAAETAAGVADAAATVANTTAAFADTAAVNAVAAADAANKAAAAADETATADDAAATTADALATAADALATAADSAATGADSAAEAADAAAGIADGVSAGAEGAATAADTTAIALDITAAATAAIPFVDIGTAAAAAVADGVAAGLDGAADATDVAEIAADGTAAGLDGTAAGLDGTAATADATAATADATAAADDAAAAAADAAAVAACEAATAANKAADTADSNANTANNLATHASAAALAADIAFYAEIATVQGTQTSLQTQTLGTGDTPPSDGIADQLNAGIRSLDLRGALVNDTINLNAGQYFTGVTLQGALNDMTTFLEANPSETIVVKLSANEAAPINSPNGFNADLNTLLNSSDTAVPGTTYNDFIYSSSHPTTTPDLGQVRGKIVIIPSGWTPTATNGQTIGWQPTGVVHDSTTVSDPAQLWNLAENDGNNAGLIPTDLGNPSTLYRTNLSQDSTTSTSPVALGDSVNAIAEQYFASGSGTVTRTTGIVGMDDPDPNLIAEIINENNLPIMVTSDSDTPSDTGTLRAAITQANSQPGVNTIVFANDLTGSTGNTISLQSDLPTITNDLVIAGTVLINTNGHQGLLSASTHDVTETDYVASDSGPVTQTQTSYPTDPVYLDTSGLTEVGPDTVAVDPVNITYGTALANSQLNGIATDSSGASIPGTFTYTSPPGSPLSAGNDQSEAVTFTPSNTSLPQESGTVIVNVAQATPTISNVTPIVNITYGTALDNTQLSGTATVPGTFVYTSAAGRVLHTGTGQSESITFIPTDTTDYTSVSSTVTVNVAQATPTVTVNPVNISYGTPLDNSQLSGTATFTVGGKSVNVPGTFAYTSAEVGTVLNGGNAQTEAVTFTPQDTTDYTTVSSNVTVNVSTHATPAVAINPVNITYGTALDNSQLSGTAIFTIPGKIVVVPGTFTYTSAEVGTVLNAGNAQSEAVTFTPSDTKTYATVSSNVIVNVAQATPAISNVNPVSITYGTALANGQLSGTATFTVGGKPVTVPGTFTYTSAAGSVLTAGNAQSEAVTFTPTDTTDYTPASGTVTVNVAQAMPTVAINPVTIIYGTALANSQLSGTVTFTVDGYLVAVPGTFTYTSAAGSLLNLGNGQSEAVTFTPTDTTDYTTVSSSVTVNVLPITPTVTVTDAGGIYKGSPFAATGTVTGVGGVNLATPTNPTFLYYLASDTTFGDPLPGAPSDAGNYVAVCLYAATGNYGVGAAKTSFSITPAATATAITSSANPAVYGQPITYTATLTNTSGTPAVPVGAVQFVVDGVNSGSPVPLNASGQAVSAPISFLTGASHSVQAVYIPSLNSNNIGNFVGSNNSLTQVVQSFAIEPDPTNPALTDLFIGSAGATSKDQVQVTPVGSSSTGSTGVKVQTSLNGVNTQTTYSQSFPTIYAFLQQGNDNVQLANALTINAVVTAGNGNDNVTLGNGNNTVTLGDGYDVIQLGGGNNTVTLGNGNDNVSAGNGNNTVTAGNGNDTIQLGGGSNVVVEGTGNDAVSAGNGNDLIVGGLGQHTIRVGNGTNILIDGSATVNNSGDSFRQILNAWTANPTASNQSAIRQRFTVNYNQLYHNTLTAGSGIDWFFYKPPTTSNKKPTDFLN
jgi:hypothetical protein